MRWMTRCSTSNVILYSGVVGEKSGSFFLSSIAVPAGKKLGVKKQLQMVHIGRWSLFPDLD